MTAYVVDASVGVKWLVPEVHSDAADRLRAAFGLHAPTFFFLEVCNVLWKMVRRGSLSTADAADCLAVLGASPVTTHSDARLAGAAFEIAVETGRTVYDSAYVALAARLGTRAVTADERLRNALRGTRWEPHLLWIEDVP